MKRILSYGLVYFLFLTFPVNAFALLGFDFDIKGSMSTGYDDNVTLANENRKSDSVTKLSAGIGAKQEGKTHDLNIEGIFTQYLFANHSSFNNNSQNVNVDFKKTLSKHDRLAITDRFVHAEDPESFEDSFGRTSGRYSYYQNILDTKYIRDISKNVSLESHYGNEIYSSSRKDVDDSSVLHRVGADAVYIHSSAMAFLLGYDFATIHAEDNGRADVHTVSTGIRHFLTKQLYLDGRAGVSFVDSFDGRNTSEPNIAVTLTNDFNKTDSANLSYRKTSMPSSDTADIWDSWQVAMNLSRQLLERLRGSVSVFFGKGEYEALSIKDTQTGVRTQLSYDVRENVTVFLSYTYSEVDSNLATRSYNRNMVDVGVKIAF